MMGPKMQLLRRDIQEFSKELAIVGGLIEFKSRNDPSKPKNKGKGERVKENKDNDNFIQAQASR